MARSRERAVTARAAPTAGVTLWRRIADDLERAIAAGEIAPGEKLPGETEIAARFAVNRHTVRRAIAELAGRGLVRAARGSGTFVEGGRLAYPISARTRFSEIVGTAGREAGGRLVASRLEPADGAIARRLKVPKGTPVVRLDVVRSASGVPLCLGTNWLPAARVPGAAKIYETTRSITRMLAAVGIRDYRRHSTRVTAAVADAIEAARLDLSPGRPLLVVESVDVTPDGKPIATSTARFAADRVELMVQY
jgi:GntR family transcriptional regulator, phosphonate transport system regulatory protein